MTRIQEFYEFIKKQPRSRSLNHGSWLKCAVGDFVDDEYGWAGLSRGVVRSASPEFGRQCGVFEVELQKKNECLWSVLNEAGLISRFCADEDNYGWLIDLVEGLE